MNKLFINKDIAAKFLNALAGQSDLDFIFQLIREQPGLGKKGKQLYGKFSDIYEELCAAQNDGYGIFVTINEMRGRKRANSETENVRALFCDMDTENFRTDHLVAPSCVVKTARGRHLYYFVQPAQDFENFHKTEKALIKYYDADPAVKDLARVMRLPGSYHLKGGTPLEVKMENWSGRVHSITEISEAYLRYENTEQIAMFKNHCNKYSIEEGSRNNNIMEISREGIALGLLPELVENEVKSYCERSGLDADEGLQVLARQRRSKTNFYSRLQEEVDLSPANLANEYLKQYYTARDGISTLRKINDQFYEFNEKCYQLIKDHALKDKITVWCQQIPALRKKAGSRLTAEILSNLGPKIASENATERPFFFSNPKKEGVLSFIFPNGVLYAENEFEFSRTPSQSNPDLFSLHSFDFEFAPSRDCPIWKKFLAEALPSNFHQQVIQEWFGLNLIPDTSFQKFLIMVGEGANGKSVVCTVLKNLLGQRNVSNVSLEALSQSSTFLIEPLIGKLANIISEVSEMNRPSESILKLLISGESITVDRKYRDPISTRITARLTIATNTFPRFTDRSQGIWRRLILIPFENQVDPTKQDRRLTQDSFWSSNGELSGIFNWALEGLERLRKRGNFNISSDLQKIAENYAVELNPARGFLLENCIQGADCKISQAELFSAYFDYCQISNFGKLSQNSFTKEVKRTFPQAQLSPSANKKVTMGGRHFRSKEWAGISLKTDIFEQPTRKTQYD